MNVIRRTLWVTLVAVVVWCSLTSYQANGYKKAPCNGATTFAKLACKLRSPVAVLELAMRSETFINGIDQGDPSTIRANNIDVVCMNTWMDFLFIFLYWSAYLLFAKAYPSVWSPFIRWTISVAAVLDVAENLFLLHGLHAMDQHTASFLTPGVASHLKWSFFAISTFLLGMSLLRQSEVSLKVISFPMLVAGTITFAGQFWIPLLLPALALLFFALLISIVALFPFHVSRRSFTRNSCFEWLNYLYFFRFSIGLWLAMPILALVDARHITSSVTLGILTPETGWQLFYSAFFIVASGWLALTLARIVSAYGAERFDIAPP